MIHGKAYAFFKCTATKAQIEVQLKNFRKLANNSSDLVLSLEDLGTFKFNDFKLIDIVRNAKQSGKTFVLEARLPSAVGSSAADELSVLLEEAYKSPFCKNAESVEYQIFYKEKFEYHQRN